MDSHAMPVLDLARWRPTRDALQVFARVLGKVRAASAPREKHWFHTTLRTEATGLATPPFASGGQVFQLRLDVTGHRLVAVNATGGRQEATLQGQSPASFRDAVLGVLAALGWTGEIDGEPFEDTDALPYDGADARSFWQAFVRLDAVLGRFRAGLPGESGPLQLWPHHFDLAFLWFTGRHVPGVDPTDEENADEQMNFGFSTGDASIPEAYIYVTAYPGPDGFVGSDLPAGGEWFTEGFQAAVLRYARLRAVSDPDGTLLEFLCAAQAAGARAMGVGTG